MQSAMITFDRFIRRHRRAVLVVWVLALLGAVPFAMKQSDNLSGGGYAVIMVGVFMIFVATGLPSIQQIGLGNAVAIAVDATLVLRPARFVRTRRFARHYGEMVLAMVAGMVVLGMPLGVVLGEGQTLMLLNMGFSMTAPMVAWMRYRGHGWQVTGEMAATMVLPTLAAIGVYAGGIVADFDAVLLAEHLVMLAAMAVAMLLRPLEYLHDSHDHGHAGVPAMA